MSVFFDSYKVGVYNIRAVTLELLYSLLTTELYHLGNQCSKRWSGFEMHVISSLRMGIMHGLPDHEVILLPSSAVFIAPS